MQDKPAFKYYVNSTGYRKFRFKEHARLTGDTVCVRVLVLPYKAV